MAEELRPDDLLRVWQNQSVENIAMSLEEIRSRAQQFRARIVHRNRREYFAAVFVLVAFTYYIYLFSEPLIRIGSGLIIAGSLWAMYQLHHRTAPPSVPVDLARTVSLMFYRGELVRQRDALQSVWSWYLLPMVPGLVVFGAGMRRGTGVVMVAYLGMFAVVFFGVWWLNRRAAMRLSQQIAELDDMEDQL